MSKSIEHEYIASKVSELIEQCEASPKIYHMTTPAIVAAAVANVPQVVTALGDSCNVHFRTDKPFIHSAPKLSNAKNRENFVMPSIDKLLTHRKNLFILTKMSKLA